MLSANIVIVGVDKLGPYTTVYQVKNIGSQSAYHVYLDTNFGTYFASPPTIASGETSTVHVEGDYGQRAFVYGVHWAIAE